MHLVGPLLHNTHLLYVVSFLISMIKHSIRAIKYIKGMVYFVLQLKTVMVEKSW